MLAFCVWCVIARMHQWAGGRGRGQGSHEELLPKGTKQSEYKRSDRSSKLVFLHLSKSLLNHLLVILKHEGSRAGGLATCDCLPPFSRQTSMAMLGFNVPKPQPPPTPPPPQWQTTKKKSKEATQHFGSNGFKNGFKWKGLFRPTRASLQTKATGEKGHTIGTAILLPRTSSTDTRRPCASTAGGRRGPLKAWSMDEAPLLNPWPLWC